MTKHLKSKKCRQTESKQRQAPKYRPRTKRQADACWACEARWRGKMVPIRYTPPTLKRSPLACVPLRRRSPPRHKRHALAFRKICEMCARWRPLRPDWQRKRRHFVPARMLVPREVTTKSGRPKPEPRLPEDASDEALMQDFQARVEEALARSEAERAGISLPPDEDDDDNEPDEALDEDRALLMAKVEAALKNRARVEKERPTEDWLGEEWPAAATPPPPAVDEVVAKSAPSKRKKPPTPVPRIRSLGDPPWRPVKPRR